MLVLVLGTGLYLVLRLRAVQIRQLPAALRSLSRRPAAGDKGDISPWAALMTAVGGIVGNGNLAGVGDRPIRGMIATREPFTMVTVL